jgi:RNA polymerase sigma-70 factor, ECF subfamily
MMSTEAPPAEVGSDEPSDSGGREEDAALVRALASGADAQNQLYVRYRRPLMQVLLHRRIDRSDAEDILQRAFLRAVRKIREEGLMEPRKLGGYLYRTTCYLATAYWRGELAREYDSDVERLAQIQDHALSLEERVQHEQLAICVRTLMDELPLTRDREVLERYYLQEESRLEIRDSLRLTELQFNQVLWRARQRFGDILRQHGIVGDNASSLE